METVETVLAHGKPKFKHLTESLDMSYGHF
jgi:hypothetical protein